MARVNLWPMRRLPYARIAPMARMNLRIELAEDGASAAPMARMNRGDSEYLSIRTYRAFVGAEDSIL